MTEQLVQSNLYLKKPPKQTKKKKASATVQVRRCTQPCNQAELSMCKKRVKTTSKKKFYQDSRLTTLVRGRGCRGRGCVCGGLRSQYWKLLLVWMSSRICCSSSSSKRPSKLKTQKTLLTQQPNNHTDTHTGVVMETQHRHRSLTPPAALPPPAAGSALKYLQN